jgi:hypothetical protein
MLLQASQAAWGPGTVARSLAHATVPRIAARTVVASSGSSGNSRYASRSIHTTQWPATAKRSATPRVCRDARTGLSGSTSLYALRFNKSKPNYTHQQTRGITMHPPDSIKTTSEQDTARRTPTLFNPVYTEEDLTSVQIVHFKPENFGDRVAFALMRVAR